MNDDESSNTVAVYETAEFVIFQSFFDKLSNDFIPPLLEGLDGYVLPLNITNIIDPENPKDPEPEPLTLFNDTISILGAIDGIKLSKCSIDPTPPLV